MVGGITFSIEVELGWGVTRYRNLDKLSEGRQIETEVLQRLLNLCDKFSIPVTFDIVDHLLLEDCNGNHDGPYPTGWFDIDPATSVEEDPEFYAPDLVQYIREAETAHELCTHTFSHIECGNVSRNLVRYELEQANKTREETGLSPSVSFVPPTHSEPNYEDLKNQGVSVIRSPHYNAKGYNEPRTPVGKFFEILFGKHPAVDPKSVNGVVQTYSPKYGTICAQYLQRGQHSVHPAYRVLPTSIRKKLHLWNLKRGVKEATKADSFVHYWCHLYDIANEQQWPQVEEFLHWLSNQRDLGKIEVFTMKELGDYAQ